jgi:cephalosporin-C deacetylase
MDTRGQGSQWSPGATPDIVSGRGADGPAGGHHPGFVTRGIESPATWYYRRLVADAVLALDAVAAHPLVDGARIAVAGNSQGGGLALAAAGLSGVVRAAAIDVPFMCCCRAVGSPTTTRTASYGAIRSTASGDGRLPDALIRRRPELRRRATAPALFSVGLMDGICPPSTVFAAYNHYAGPKDISVWPFNGHGRAS